MCNLYVCIVQVLSHGHSGGPANSPRARIPSAQITIGDGKPLRVKTSHEAIIKTQEHITFIEWMKKFLSGIKLPRNSYPISIFMCQFKVLIAKTIELETG